MFRLFVIIMDILILGFNVLIYKKKSEVSYKYVTTKPEEPKLECGDVYPEEEIDYNQYAVPIVQEKLHRGRNKKRQNVPKYRREYSPKY